MKTYKKGGSGTSTPSSGTKPSSATPSRTKDPGSKRRNSDEEEEGGSKQKRKKEVTGHFILFSILAAVSGQGEIF